MNGSFFVVATPIGNLDDLSPRARTVLSSADLILAEDTRHTYKLLKALNLHSENSKLLSCHQYNEQERVNQVVDEVALGRHVALVCDAGTPTVSDPGGRLIERLVASGVEVQVCPGPSAVLAALMGAGLNTTHFAFLGFLPKKGKERQARVRNALGTGLAAVFYESAERVEQTMMEFRDLCGPLRAVVARELTKKHETFHRGTLGESMTPPLVLKGEMVVVLEPPATGDPSWMMGLDPEQQSQALEKLVKQLAEDDSLPPKAAAKALMQETGWPRRKAYDAILAARQSRDD